MRHKAGFVTAILFSWFLLLGVPSAFAETEARQRLLEVFEKISAVNGWQEIPFGSNNGDNTITITLTDGDPLTDVDGLENGEIDDPGALATTSSGSTSSSGGGGGGGCFITSAAASQTPSARMVLILPLVFGGMFRIYSTIRD